MTESRVFAFRDLVEILWLPLLIGTATAAMTWVIWYYTGVPCPPEAALLHHCNPTPIARYVNTEVWALCLTLGTLTGGLVGGGVNYTMFSRERAGRIAAEIVAAEERKLREKMVEEERKLREADRKLREEDRKRIDQLVEQLSENQRLVAESQRQTAETQRQAAEAQLAMLSAITALTAEVSELRRQRNGENGQ